MRNQGVPKPKNPIPPPPRTVKGNIMQHTKDDNYYVTSTFERTKDDKESFLVRLKKAFLYVVFNEKP